VRISDIAKKARQLLSILSALSLQKVLPIRKALADRLRDGIDSEIESA
jgi:hypothetical protein